MADPKGKVDVKVLEAKLDKGEELTKEEEQFLLEDEGPVDGFAKPTITDEQKPDEEKEEPAVKSAEEIKAEKDAAVAKQAKDDKIKALGLPETATNEEITAAETKIQQAQEANDPFLKIEKELQKPEGQEDLKDFTVREKAYFHQMRRDRKAKQKAEEERDGALFELSKAKKEPTKKEEPAAAKDPLEGRDDTDFLTVADVKKILAGAPKDQSPVTTASFVSNPMVHSFLEKCDAEASGKLADYEEVMALTEEIINTNPAYQKQVVEALMKGDNPAVKIYELIKGDPEFSKLFPVAQTKVKARKSKASETSVKKEEPKVKTADELEKEKKAKEAEDALEQNKNKPKTSGHAEGKEVLEGTDLTIEQIASMSDMEFRKLPKKARQKYLELYG